MIESLDTHMGSVNLRGMLESDDKLADRARLTVKRALNAGSSKQGNARRASVGENWVLANHLQKCYTDVSG